MDFMGLKIAGALFLAWVAWVTFKKVHEHITTRAAVNETLDTMTATASDLAKKFEDYATKKAIEVETYVNQKTNLEATITTVTADIEKAKELAEKVKAIL